MNLPRNIGIEFKSIMPVIHEDGSMSLFFVEDKPIKLTQAQVFELAIFFKQPAVEYRIGIAFLEDQRKYDE